MSGHEEFDPITENFDATRHQSQMTQRLSECVSLVGSGVVTDEQVLALRQRNERRAECAKNSLGIRYLMHPFNRIKRKINRRAGV